MKSRNSKGRLAPFVPLLKGTISTEAWRAMSHGARSLYVALKGRYNNTLGNSVYLSTRDAEKELGSFSHRDAVRRWFRELEHYGFIVMIRGGSLGVDGRGKAPHWRLTEEWYASQPPTRDYLNWDGVVFSEQKATNRYGPKKQNPGPCVQATVDHASGPVVDHASGPPDQGSGPCVQAIQPHDPGPDAWSITSSPSTPLGKATSRRPSRRQ
jgi:hypothetical protein